MSEGPRIAVAVVTMGNRPDEVDALLTSVAKQDVAPARIVIVGNGCPLPQFAERLGLPGEVTGIEVDENLGCPGGRNVGLARLREFADVDVVVELDDDGLLVDADVLRKVRDLYTADPRLGIVGFRIADEHGETQRRHVPRVGAKDPMRGGPVTGFLGGGHALSMPMLARIRDSPASSSHTRRRTWPGGPSTTKLDRALRARTAAPAPQDLARPARHLLPGHRPQPGLAHPSQAAPPAHPRAPGNLDAADARTDALARRGCGPGSAASRKGCGSRAASGGRCGGERCGGSRGWHAPVI